MIICDICKTPLNAGNNADEFISAKRFKPLDGWVDYNFCVGCGNAVHETIKTMISNGREKRTNEQTKRS